MNEFEFINKYFKPLTSKEAQNLKNDAALYKPKPVSYTHLRAHETR